MKRIFTPLSDKLAESMFVDNELVTQSGQFKVWIEILSDNSNKQTILFDKT